jgi:hypothetical protein
MVKYTQKELNLRNSLLVRPKTVKGRLLKRRRAQAREREEIRLNRTVGRKTPRTMQMNTSHSMQRTAVKSTKSVNPFKFKKLKVKSTRKKLGKILKSTSKHIKQTKNMIRFLNKFMDKYNSVEDTEKYEVFASELSAGLYDIAGDEFGDDLVNYDPADPINYLESFKNHLQKHAYTIDPDTINRLYEEFKQEQATLTQVKDQNMVMNANNNPLSSLFDKENGDDSVGDDLLSMFSSFKM